MQKTLLFGEKAHSLVDYFTELDLRDAIQTAATKLGIGNIIKHVSIIIFKTN